MKSAIRAAVVLALALLAAGCSGGPQQTEQTAAAYRHPLRGGFTPAKPYDPKVNAPVERYYGDPTRYTRHWDAEKDGGTGVYEPWRDPMWTPMEEMFGVL